MTVGINRYIITGILLLAAYVRICPQEMPVTSRTLPKTRLETPVRPVVLSDSLRWMQDFKTGLSLYSYSPRQNDGRDRHTAISENVTTWHGSTIVGGSGYDTMYGLMDRRHVGFNAVRHYGNLTVAMGLSANKYALPVDRRLTMLGMSAVQDQFGISGLVRYDFNENVSATVYGQYFSNTFYYSLAAFPYIPASSYGAFITLHNGDTGIDLGVNRHYDPFARRWQTDPVVRPTFKIGKVKTDIDFGPLIKQAMLHIMDKKGSRGPMIMPDM